jgi:transcriptional regulator with XRE-family HTH domain
MHHINGRPIQYYLRSYRKHAHLTQEDLAYLLGAATGAKVSRYESGNRTPTLLTGLAYEAALGVPVSKLFRGSYEEIEAMVAERRRKLDAQKGIEQKVDAQSHRAA